MRMSWRSLRVFFLAILMVAFLGAPGLSAGQPDRILVFGDSNSWGWIPTEKGIPTERYPADTRWPGAMRAQLGDEYEVVVDALSGRTTDLHDPTFKGITGAGLNGRQALPSVLGSHFPLDLVIIMLGTNDTKAHFNRSAFRIALGAGNLVDIARNSGHFFGGGWYKYGSPRVLLIAPPPIGEQKVFGDLFKGGIMKSKRLADAMEHIAAASGAAFFDAGTVIRTDGVDGVHFSAEMHRTLGRAVAKRVRDILE